MKRMLCLMAAAALLLCGCSSPEDEAVEDVRKQITALPSVEEFQTLTTQTQQEIYDLTQSCYDAYMALTDHQRQQLPEAEQIFGDLFAHFNAQVEPIDTLEPLRDKLLALPGVEDFQAMTEIARLSVYEQLQSLYEEYKALTPEQQAQIPEAEGIFDALFAHINEQVMPLTEAAPPVVLSDTDQQLLLQIGMAELGQTQCETCIALVMCTVLNRVADDRFPSSVERVLYAQDQFTPVVDGSFFKAKPNDACRKALEMVLGGWDESQGALYYEFCEGASWHSQNLNLLTEHCNTRFYN